MRPSSWADLMKLGPPMLKSILWIISKAMLKWQQVFPLPISIHCGIQRDCIVFSKHTHTIVALISHVSLPESPFWSMVSLKLFFFDCQGYYALQVTHLGWRQVPCQSNIDGMQNGSEVGCYSIYVLSSTRSNSRSGWNQNWGFFLEGDFYFKKYSSFFK